MAFKAEVQRSNIFPEVIIFAPSFASDLRGDIYTSYDKAVYNKHLPAGLDFIHDKFAKSKQNVLRGLHGDSKTWKLVSCVFGSIVEVIADMRPESPTYLKWEKFSLDDLHKRQVLIPPGFVNGYFVESEAAVFHYKLAYTGDYIDASDQKTIKWNDPALKINWPCTNPILQDRDR